MPPVFNVLTRRTLFGASAAFGLATVRPARAETPKFKTVEDGYITIAISGTMPVTGLQDGKLSGSDALMVQAIAEKLGLKAKPAVMAWSATIQAIRSGRADIMCGDMGWSKARSDAMLLTDPIYYSGNFVTMTKDKPFTTGIDPNQLKGAIVGTGTGYSYVPDIKKIPGIKDVKLYDNVDGCVRDVLAGRIDYAILDSMTVDYMLLQQPDLALKQVPVTPNTEYPSLTGKGRAVMGMSQDNPDLFDVINAGVKWLWDTKQNAKFLAQNGMVSPDYLTAPTVDPRIGVDRDAAGAVLGPAAHSPKNYSSLFA